MQNVMENLGDIIKREQERDNIINEKFISYFKIKFKYCTIKQDVLELFCIWIVEKGAMRSIVFDEDLSPCNLDEFIDENIDSFSKYFNGINKFGVSKFLSKEALREFFLAIYNAKYDIYTLMKQKGHISISDNIGNRFTPNKAKWFNDLPTEKQLEIEYESQLERDEIFRKFNDTLNKQTTMKKTKHEAKSILVANTKTIFYGGPDGKVYAIYFQLPESVPVEFVLVECFGLHYDYTNEKVFKDVRQGDLIVREPILESELKPFLKSYRCPNSPKLQTCSTVTEVLEYLNSTFKE